MLSLPKETIAALFMMQLKNLLFRLITVPISDYFQTVWDAYSMVTINASIAIHLEQSFIATYMQAHHSLVI